MSIDRPTLHCPYAPGLDLTLIVATLHYIFGDSSLGLGGILVFVGGDEVKDMVLEGELPSEPTTGDFRQFVDDLPARLKFLKRTLLIPFS